MPLQRHDGKMKWYEPVGRGFEHTGCYAFAPPIIPPQKPNHDCPGSWGRVQELARRARANEMLWHPEDRKDYEEEA